MTGPPDTRCKLVRWLKRRGWAVVVAGSGHYRATAPDGTTLTFAASPSDRRSFRNALAGIRRVERKEATGD